MAKRPISGCLPPCRVGDRILADLGSPPRSGAVFVSPAASAPTPPTVPPLLVVSKRSPCGAHRAHLSSLPPRIGDREWVGALRQGEGYEAVRHASRLGPFYLMIEAQNIPTESSRERSKCTTNRAASRRDDGSILGRAPPPPPFEKPQHWIRRSRVGGLSRRALPARALRGQNAEASPTQKRKGGRGTYTCPRPTPSLPPLASLSVHLLPPAAARRFLEARRAHRLPRHVKFRVLCGVGVISSIPPPPPPSSDGDRSPSCGMSRRGWPGGAAGNWKINDFSRALLPSPCPPSPSPPPGPRSISTISRERKRETGIPHRGRRSVDVAHDTRCGLRPPQKATRERPPPPPPPPPPSPPSSPEAENSRTDPSSRRFRVRCREISPAGRTQ